MNAGREKVRVANALGELPKVGEAFRQGEISYSKVRAITRVATPENEDYLLKIARHGTAHHVETLVSGYRRACRLNDEELAENQFKNRSLNYRWDDDGSLVFDGRLPGDVGALLLKALQSAVDNVDRDEDVTAETWQSISTRRADALAEMAERYLETGPAKSASADRYQVMVHVSAETLESDVTAETSRRFCCDGSVSKLIEDGKGEPLSIGRKSRVIPPPMHDNRQRGQIGADGGETSLDNLVQLCRFHHRLVHEGGFGCQKDRHGTIVFRNEYGLPISESGYKMPQVSDNVVINLKEKRHWPMYFSVLFPAWPLLARSGCRIA